MGTRRVQASRLWLVVAGGSEGILCKIWFVLLSGNPL